MRLKTVPKSLLKDKDIKFGTSGLRGLVKDFDDFLVTSFTISFLTYLKDSGFKFKRVVVGKDLRASSPRILNAVLHGIRQLDLTPINGGDCPTPALGYYCSTHRCPGIMVTGSHIPEDRNGLKFFKLDGEINKSDEQGILNKAVTLDLAGFNKSGTLKVQESNKKDPKVLLEYRNRYTRVFGEDFLSGLRVGIYKHSCVGANIFFDILKELGASPVAFGKSDRFMAIDTEDLNKEALATVRGWLNLNEVDCVISADGDADRPLVFTSKGDPLPGDYLGRLSLIFTGAKIAVCPITVNSQLENYGLTSSIAQYEVIRTKIGSPYVIQEMLSAPQDKNTVGFEANGGVIHRDELIYPLGSLKPLLTRDSLLPILSYLFFLKSTKIEKPWYDLGSVNASGMLRGINPSKINKLLSCSELLDTYGGSENRLDGLRLTLPDNTIIHFRLSGNAPELRVYVEAKDEFSSLLLLQKAINYLKSKDIF